MTSDKGEDLIDLSHDNGVPLRSHPPPTHRVVLYYVFEGKPVPLLTAWMSQDEAIAAVSHWMTGQATHGLISSPHGLLRVEHVLVVLEGRYAGEEEAS